MARTDEKVNEAKPPGPELPPVAADTASSFPTLTTKRIEHTSGPSCPACKVATPSAETVKPPDLHPAYLAELEAQRAEVERMLGDHPEWGALEWRPTYREIGLNLTPYTPPVDPQTQLQNENRALRRALRRLRNAHRSDIEALADVVAEIETRLPVKAGNT